MESVLILGNGQAGIALARELRKLDPRRPITLVGRDAHSFNRAEFVQALGPSQKQLTLEELLVLGEQLRIDMVPNCTAQSIRVSDCSVQTDHGEYQADKLVLALGSSPMLPTFARDLPGLVAAVTHANVVNKLRARLASVKDWSSLAPASPVVNWPIPWPTPASTSPWSSNMPARCSN